MSDKIMIKKNTVQETLLIPLYGRKLAMDMYPDLFHDQDAQNLFEQIFIISSGKMLRNFFVLWQSVFQVEKLHLMQPMLQV